MFIDFQEIHSLGTDQFQLIAATATAAANGLQTISAEAAEFSKKRIETNYALGQQLLRARKLDEIVELQSDFARASFDDFIVQATKFRSLYSDLAKEILKSAKVAPLEKAAIAAPRSNGPVAAKQTSAQ